MPEPVNARATSDERFELLAQLPGDILSLISADGEVFYVSPAVEHTLGYTRDHYVESIGIDLIHPQDRDTMRATWEEVMAEPDAERRFEFRIRHADGGWRYMDAIATNRIDDPKVSAVVANYRDVTERRLTELALRHSEERATRLLESSSDVLLLVRPDGEVTWCSRQARATFGYDPSELAGRNAFEFVHPDDLEDAEASYLSTVASEQPEDAVVVRVRHADGNWRWAEVLATSLVDDPGIGQVMLSLRDITDRVETRKALEESEARFRAVVDNSRDLTGIIDAEGMIAWVSPNSKEMLGRPPEELIGTPAFDLVHPDDADAVATRFAGSIEGSNGGAPLALRVTCADGSWLPVEGLGTPLPDADGDTEAIIFNVRDVSWRIAAEEALRQSEERFRALVQNSSDATVVVDPDGTLRYVSPALEQLFGRPVDEITQEDGLAFLHPDDAQWVTEELADLADRPGDSLNRQFRVLDADGETRWVETTVTNMLDNDAVGGLVANIRDATERLTTEREMQRLIDIFEFTSDLVGVGDISGQLVYLNAAARRFFGLADGMGIDDLDPTGLFPDLSRTKMDAILLTLDRGDTWNGEFALRRHDGAVVPTLATIMSHRDEQGRIEFFSGVLRDISERKAFELELEHQATHDPLTGLPNRTLLLDRIEMGLARSRRTGTRVGVLFLDLDNFKVVNDSMGHSRGDELLVTLAGRLRGVIRPSDTVARFGGDEFVVLCEDLEDEDAAINVAKRVDHALSGPTEVAGTDVFVGLSMGVALSTDQSTPELLIRDADAAMYRAKQRGRSRIELFDETMLDAALDRLELERALRRAVDGDQLELHYQPIISLTEPAGIVGVEALLRWNHPERGLLLPGEFISVAEETGLIRPIGSWVMREATRQLEAWMGEHRMLADLSLSLNLSARQIADEDLVDEVDQVLHAASLDAHRVMLEITESVVMEDAAVSQRTLNRLKDLGVGLAIDDFGTGYSSLSYLRHYPFDHLKIDRSLVDDLGADPDDSAIVVAIVSLAHTLGMTAVAEGIETEDQYRELVALGCDLAQGHLISRAVQAPDLPDFAAAGAPFRH